MISLGLGLQANSLSRLIVQNLKSDYLITGMLGRIKNMNLQIDSTAP